MGQDGILRGVGNAAWPIDNRPQITNLPHIHEILSGSDCLATESSPTLAKHNLIKMLDLRKVSDIDDAILPHMLHSKALSDACEKLGGNAR